MRAFLLAVSLILPVTLSAQDAGAEDQPDRNNDVQTSPVDIPEEITETIQINFPFQDKTLKITSDFGYRQNPLCHYKKSEFHNGVDIGAWHGMKVYAAHSGRVLKYGENSASGKYLYIESEGATYKTGYLHLGGRPVEVLKVGAKIEEGQYIGWVAGPTEYVTGPHLHFELWTFNSEKNDFEAIDPEDYFIDYLAAK